LDRLLLAMGAMLVSPQRMLWPAVHEVRALRDHRENDSDPLDVQYGPAHEVELVRGAFLHSLAGQDRILVNSLHSQGIRTLGEGLLAEAYAPDGLVEAVRVRDASGFAVGVQWHPEWKVTSNAFSQAQFHAFAGAAHEYARQHRM
jgi:putative glutamine amidotransferase